VKCRRPSCIINAGHAAVDRETERELKAEYTQHLLPVEMAFVLSCVDFNWPQDKTATGAKLKRPLDCLPVTLPPLITARII